MKRQAAAPRIPAPNYTPMPNALIKLFPLMKEAELRVTLAIARETFGWHRKKAKLTIPELCIKTGMSNHGVPTGIKQGMDRGTIGREQIGKTFRYFLNILEETDELDTPSKMGYGEQDTPSKMGVIPHPKWGLSPIQNGGSSFIEKENIKERKKNLPHTHNMLNGATKKDVVCVCESKFSLEECLAYAESLKGVSNPGGFAITIWRTGEQDTLIDAWKNKSAASVDPSRCPDCEGRGFIYPNGIGNGGVVKCKHPQLVGVSL